MTDKRKILVIDDDRTNLALLKRYLMSGENTSHEVITASNGLEGWQLLMHEHQNIDVILLDRMMPVMTGDEFIKKLKQNPDVKGIPVIMQTMCNSREEVQEGFRLGVYHYLVKPYSATLLNSIVHSAINFYSNQRDLISAVTNTQILFKYVDHAVFKIKNLQDVKPISASLARLFPNPDKVVLGIAEILTNAIEHGNIGISYEEKTRLNLECKWLEEVEKRLSLPENKDKVVMVSFFKNDDDMRLNIKDAGNGFDYRKYLDFDPDRSTDNHGRGIAFANKLSFDYVEYVGKGNEVNCIVKSQ